MTSSTSKPFVPLLTVFLLLSFHVQPARAAESCTVHTGELTWVYEGYPIVFEGPVLRVLTEKSYVVVPGEVPAGYQLQIRLGSERGRYFEHATAAFVFAGADDEEFRVHSKARKRCLTEFCPADHFLPPLRRIVREMEKRIPRCMDSLPALAKTR